MRSETEIPYPLMDVLSNKMPSYLVGRIDQTRNTAQAICTGLHVVLLLIVLSGIPHKLVLKTTLGIWLESVGISFTGVCFLVWLLSTAYARMRVPDRVYHYNRDKIIRLRIALGHWPHFTRMPYPRHLTLITDEKIVSAMESMKAELADWPHVKTERDHYPQE